MWVWFFGVLRQGLTMWLRPALNLWYPLPQPPEDWDYKDILVPLAGFSFKNWNCLMSHRVQKKREGFPECRKEVTAWTETMVSQSSWVNRKIKMVKTCNPNTRESEAGGL